MKNPSTHIARWLEYLQEFNFTIQRRQCSAQGNADGLSRRYESLADESSTGNKTPTTDVIRHITHDDHLYQPATSSTGPITPENEQNTG
jgi:hypothetical protein